PIRTVSTRPCTSIKMTPVKTYLEAVFTSRRMAASIGGERSRRLLAISHLIRSIHRLFMERRFLSVTARRQPVFIVRQMAGLIGEALHSMRARTATLLTCVSQFPQTTLFGFIQAIVVQQQTQN